MATNTTATFERTDAVVRFAPLAQNAYRILGLAGGASQQEIYDAAASLRRAFKLGVSKSFAGDAEWLGPLSRSESDARDALSRLAVPSQRIFERLFWPFDGEFTAISSLEGLQTTIEKIVSKPGASAQHDAAVLSLAALNSFDAKLKEREAWVRALRLWAGVVGADEFWSLLVASDLKGDFEQLVSHGEVRELRRRTLRLVTTPVADRAKDAVARNDSRACRDALSILRDARLPEKLYAEHESDILGPVEDNFEEVCQQVFALVRVAASGANKPETKRELADEAFVKFDAKLKPQLREVLNVAGRESLITRRALESVAAGLCNMAAAYESAGDLRLGLSTYRKAWALAPPGSATLLLVEESLRASGRDDVIKARTEDEYFDALARELRQLPPRRELFADYIKAESRSETRIKTRGIVSDNWWLIGLAILCGILARCGAGGSRRSARPFPYSNYNINYRMPVPQFTPFPPVRIEPMMLPPKLSGGATRKSAGPPRATRRRRERETKKP
ncbi:MAG TPA: hypothetical protein VM934_13790 [Pyrinomonadaceae bacterium]|nr:hypothetical protein [Pyrinomonadaceae bacterium]